MSEQDSIEAKKTASPAPGSGPDSGGPEEAGTQALSEALKSSFFIIQFVMVILVGVFCISGFFTVDPQHRAIILRMGKPLGQGEQALLGPGWHFAFPRPIDESVLIPYTSIQTADSTVGWYLNVEDRKRGAPEPRGDMQLDPAGISYVLTADTNIIHVMATARYRITDPIQFTFNFTNAAGFVTNDLNNALLYAATRFTVDDALTAQRAEFKDVVERRMKQLVDQQHLGVTVDAVEPVTSAALAVKPDFQRVVEAASQGQDTINKAIAYRNLTMGHAMGEKESRIKTAEVEKQRMVGLIGAEATNFSLQLAHYEADPDLVKRVLREDILRQVWGRAAQLEVMPDMDGRQLRIHLSQPQAQLYSSGTNNNSGQ